MMSDIELLKGLINIIRNQKVITGEDLKVFNGLSTIINERWITIHPHGDVEDEDGKKDYRRLKLEDGESPKEAINRVYGKSDKSKDDTANKEKTKRNFSDIDENDILGQKEYFTSLDIDNLNIEEIEKELENFQKLKLYDMEFSDRKIFQEVRMKLDKGIKKGRIKKEADKIGGYTQKLNNVWKFDRLADISWMPENAQAELYEKCKAIHDKFPFIDLSAIQKGSFMRKRTLAQYTPWRVIELNPEHYLNIEKMQESYENCVRKKFHPVGTDYNSVITHEIGHALHDYIAKVKGISASTIKSNVLKRLKIKQKDLTDNLSEYATIHPRLAHEFFAEAFAEGFDSKNPRPIASEFMKEIESILRS